MKGVLVVALLVVVVGCSPLPVKESITSLLLSRDTAAVGKTCPVYTCITATKPTGVACGLVGSQFENCPSGFYCNSTTVECAQYLDIGDVGCTVGEPYDSCAEEAQCVLGRSGQKWRSETAAPNTPVCQAYTYLASVGQPCSDVSQCLPSLECDNGLCADVPTVGQSCSASLNCYGSSFCNPAGQCTAMFTVNTGGSCSDTTDCVPGDWCNQPSAPSAGKCAAGLTSSGKACSADTDCSTNQVCSCAMSATATTGQCTAPTVYTSDQASSLTTLLDCLAQNDCGGPLNSMNTASQCQPCQKAYCNYYNNIITSDQQAFYAALPCIANGMSDAVAFQAQYCTASHATTVATSVALMLMAMALLVLL